VPENRSTPGAHDRADKSGIVNLGPYRPSLKRRCMRPSALSPIYQQSGFAFKAGLTGGASEMLGRFVA
jgi:demethoxyubiquinone hydroxylase (CLK1/Coq7/Cat5 family)